MFRDRRSGLGGWQYGVFYETLGGMYKCKCVHWVKRGPRFKK